MSRANAVSSLTTSARGPGAVKCRTVRARLPGELLGTWPLSASGRIHLESCLTCQAQAARYRAILRALRSLRDDIEEAPARLLEQVLLSLDPIEEIEEARARTAIAISAIAASVAAATAIVVLRWMRSGAI